MAHKWQVVLVTHHHQKCVRKEISRPGFLDVIRYSIVHSIDLRRVFLRCYIFRHAFLVAVCHARGCMVGCMGRISHKFKKSYGDLRNRNFEKSHRTTGPRSDLRPTGPRSDLRPDL